MRALHCCSGGAECPGGDWHTYFAHGGLIGPPPPARPAFGGRAQAVFGGVVAFVLLLGLIVAAAVGVTR